MAKVGELANWEAWGQLRLMGRTRFIRRLGLLTTTQARLSSCTTCPYGRTTFQAQQARVALDNAGAPDEKTLGERVMACSFLLP